MIVMALMTVPKVLAGELVSVQRSAGLRVFWRVLA